MISFSNIWHRINSKLSFNWLFNEREVSLKSGLCLLIYFVLLIGCVYLFYLCSKVPTREFDVKVEEIKSDWNSKEQAVYSELHADIYLTIPMTMQKDKLELDNGVFSYNIYHKTTLDTLFTSVFDRYFYYLEKYPYKADSLKYRNYELFAYLNHREERKAEFANELSIICSEIDNDANIEDTLKRNIFLVDFTQKTNEGYSLLFSPNKIYKEYSNGKSIMETSGESDSIRIKNIWCLNTNILSGTNTQNYGAINTPSWINLSDISQGYYSIKLSSAKIDDIYLNIDFCGVSQFSVLSPIPDEITMSRIRYTDKEKIDKIKRDGLVFHVSFPEMQNKQKVREFTLSGAMSVLLTLILNDLLLLGLGKIRRKKEEE